LGNQSSRGGALWTANRSRCGASRMSFSLAAVLLEWRGPRLDLAVRRCRLSDRYATSTRRRFGRAGRAGWWPTPMSLAKSRGTHGCAEGPGNALFFGTAMPPETPDRHLAWSRVRWLCSLTTPFGHKPSTLHLRCEDGRVADHQVGRRWRIEAMLSGAGPGSSPSDHHRLTAPSASQPVRCWRC